MFRSKCRWVEQGERPTKYFFNLERRNYNKKVISELETENGNLIILIKLKFWQRLGNIIKTCILLKYLQRQTNSVSSPKTSTSQDLLMMTAHSWKALLHSKNAKRHCHLSVTGNRQEKMDLRPNFTMNFLTSWVQTQQIV